MKFKITLLLTLITNILFAQVDVPAKYWIEDSNFEEKINENHAFGDDDKLRRYVESWIRFNVTSKFK